MRLNENLPPGTLAADVSSRYECLACEGAGQIEAIVSGEDEKHFDVKMVTCPDCFGLGCVNTRGGL